MEITQAVKSKYIGKGGIGGYLLRRSMHVSSIIIPIAYYYYNQLPASICILESLKIIVIILILAMVSESLRLKHSWLIVGQRGYEYEHVSGFTWSICCSFLVVMTLGNEALALAIIVSFALGDPLMGEMRRMGFRPWQVVIVVWVVITAIWQGCILYYQIPFWWLLLIMPPITVVAELPKLRWIDDNAVMQLVPLAVIKLLFMMGVLY